MSNSIKIARHWEQAAESFLNNQGLKTLTRNYRCRLGEIDLVMREGNCLVFAEVRYRKVGSYGSGAESIGRSKRQKLLRAAAFYLKMERISSHQPCRFDVVSVSNSDQQGSPGQQFEWIRDAFQAEC